MNYKASALHELREYHVGLQVVNFDKLEDLLAASNPEYLESIANSRQQAASGEVFALEDVFDDL